MPFRSLAADDIFISYTRLDASTYAAGLADELTKKGFSCFIDRQFIVPGTYEPGSGRKHNAGRVALSADGRLRAAKSDGPISLWDVETGLLLGRLGPEKYPFRVGEDYPSDFMVLSRDGKALVIASGGSSSGVIDVWNLDPETWTAMAKNIIGRR